MKRAKGQRILLEDKVVHLGKLRGGVNFINFTLKKKHLSYTFRILTSIFNNN